MKIQGRRLAVVFPGIGYHADKPLLYYSRKLAAQQAFVLSPQGGLSAAAAAMSVSAGFQDPDSRRRFRRFSLPGEWPRS